VVGLFRHPLSVEAEVQVGQDGGPLGPRGQQPPPPLKVVHGGVERRSRRPTTHGALRERRLRMREDLRVFALVSAPALRLLGRVHGGLPLPRGLLVLLKPTK